MEKMECPKCGGLFDEMDITIGDNGNPVCFNCFDNEEDIKSVKEEE